MNTGVISARYAKALLAYAMEHGAEDAVYGSMKELVRTLQQVREFHVLLRNPLLKPARRVELICSAMGSSSLLERFVSLVVKEEREDMLIFIAYEYMALYREAKGISAVRFVTAKPLDEESKSRLERLIEESEGVKVEMEYVVDDSIIGGFRMEVASRRIDASVEGQLRRIRKSIVKQNRKLV